jgi:hypothetical protein
MYSEGKANVANITRILHYEVAENIDIPQIKPGQYAVVIHNIRMHNWRVTPQNVRIFREDF